MIQSQENKRGYSPELTGSQGGRWTLVPGGCGHDRGMGPGSTFAEEVKSCKKMFRFVTVLNQKLSFPVFSCGFRAYGECWSQM